MQWSCKVKLHMCFFPTHNTPVAGWMALPGVSLSAQSRMLRTVVRRSGALRCLCSASSPSSRCGFSNLCSKGHRLHCSSHRACRVYLLSSACIGFALQCRDTCTLAKAAAVTAQEYPLPEPTVARAFKLCRGGAQLCPGDRLCRLGLGGLILEVHTLCITHLECTSSHTSAAPSATHSVRSVLKLCNALVFN